MNPEENYENQAQTENQNYENQTNNSNYGGTGYNEEPNPNICRECGIHAIDRTESVNSVLCSQCREKHLKFRVPKSIKIFLAVMVVAVIASFITVPSLFVNFKEYNKAEKHMKNREYVSAYNSYMNVLEKDNENVDIMLKAAEAAHSAQYFASLAEIIDDYLVGKYLNDDDYAKAMKYSNLLDEYAETYSQVEDLFAHLEQEYMQGDEVDEAALFEDLHDELTALLGVSGTNKAIIHFYLGNVSESLEDVLKYYALATEDRNITYTHCYYGNVLRRAGRFDEAREVYNNAIRLNAEDAASIRGLGILELLEGDKTGALKKVRKAFEIEPYGLYVAESLVITLCENGMRDEAMEYLAQFESEGFVRDEDFAQYLEGTLSLNDYYIGE